MRRSAILAVLLCACSGASGSIGDAVDPKDPSLEAGSSGDAAPGTDAAHAADAPGMQEAGDEDGHAAPDGGSVDSGSAAEASNESGGVDSGHEAAPCEAPTNWSSSDVTEGNCWIAHCQAITCSCAGGYACIPQGFAELWTCTTYASASAAQAAATADENDNGYPACVVNQPAGETDPAPLAPTSPDCIFVNDTSVCQVSLVPGCYFPDGGYSTGKGC